MEQRPKIVVQTGITDKVLEAVCLALLVAGWTVPIWGYAHLPAEIPIHFNASGAPDNYGSRWSIFTLPCIATALYVLLTVLNKRPDLFNYATPVTEGNSARLYRQSTRMMRLIKLAMVFVFGMITFKTVQTATGKTKGLGVWTLPIVLFLTLAPVIHLLIAQLRRKKPENT